MKKVCVFYSTIFLLCYNIISMENESSKNSQSVAEKYGFAQRTTFEHDNSQKKSTIGPNGEYIPAKVEHVRSDPHHPIKLCTFGPNGAACGLIGGNDSNSDDDSSQKQKNVNNK